MAERIGDLVVTCLAIPVVLLSGLAGACLLVIMFLPIVVVVAIVLAFAAVGFVVITVVRWARE